MNNDSLLDKAINSVINSRAAYCKFLSANDSGETGGHQAGVLISKKAVSMLFDDSEQLSGIVKRTVRIKWQDNYETNSAFTYYSSKNELRVTKFGRDFEYIDKESTGALFVLTEQDRENYSAFLLNTEDEINRFLENFNISAAETNNLINTENSIKDYRSPEGLLYVLEHNEILKFLNSIKVDSECTFPSSDVMSAAARKIEETIHNHKNYVISNPDSKIISWIEQEYKLFRAVEFNCYSFAIAQGFHDMDSFIDLANTVLNRRKSRAGKSLEHHIAALFDANEIEYESQVITEGNKRPDFIFPSGHAYHDFSFPVGKLVSLAAKTTCKDRWRQVLNEADRLRDGNKYLLTLQQGISSSQLKEMAAEKVVLVVPKEYIKTYPSKEQESIWTVKKFIDYVKEIQTGGAG